MAERTEDPRAYRGGVREPADAKGDWADNEGVVPREELDDLPPQDTSDPQVLKDEVMGEVTGDPTDGDHQIDPSSGDNADATRDDSAHTDTVHTDPATLAGRTGQGRA
jgi:hypothetical protein